MAALSVPRVRLRHHRLVDASFPGVAEVVSAFGAVQAQDYAGALLGIALRTADATGADVERAVADRSIVRTWPMRGTLHFVAPELVRSMLRVLTPRVIRRAARRYEELELDAATVKKSRALFERALRDGKARTRSELYELLARAKIDPNAQRGIHLLGHAAMNGLICFGPRRGKHPTFVLLEEWVPPAAPLDDDELLGELARRYFRTHGPATEHDFAWWIGGSLGEARRAIASIRGELASTIEGARTLYGEDLEPTKRKGFAHLLPPWDEYTVGYRDRSDIVDEEHARAVRGGVLSPVIVLDGRVVATWTRKTTKTGVAIAATAFREVTPAQRRAVDAAVDRYGRFANAPATITWRRQS